MDVKHFMRIENQKDFYRELSDRSGRSQKECVEFYSHIVDMIVDSANHSDETKTILPMIGSLKVKVKPVHYALNPTNGTKVLVDISRRSNLHLFPRFNSRLNSEIKN